MKSHANPANHLLGGKMFQPQYGLVILARMTNLESAKFFISDFWNRFIQTSLCLFIALFSIGCSTPVLDHARTSYYKNTPQAGIKALNNASIPKRDKILFHMERGALYQLDADYKQSTIDFNDADALYSQMDTLSVTRGAGSMVASDNVLNFYGYPFERTYLHVINGLNYMALNDWQGAGVEGRRIINSLKPENIGKFPKDAFSRYFAGLCMELVDDPANARVEYRHASKISKNLDVSDNGMLLAEGAIDLENDQTQPPAPPKAQTYLVCIILSGRIADYSRSLPAKNIKPPRISIFADGTSLGNAVTIVDLGNLALKSEAEWAVLHAAKTAARVAGKVAISDSISKHNDLVGSLVYLVLMSLEQPDFRHWETLPRFISIARTPCPADLSSVELSVITAKGSKRLKITRPIQKQGNLFITFDRIF